MLGTTTEARSTQLNVGPLLICEKRRPQALLLEYSWERPTLCMKHDCTWCCCSTADDQHASGISVWKSLGNRTIWRVKSWNAWLSGVTWEQTHQYLCSGFCSCWFTAQIVNIAKMAQPYYNQTMGPCFLSRSFNRTEQYGHRTSCEYVRHMSSVGSELEETAWHTGFAAARCSKQMPV